MRPRLAEHVAIHAPAEPGGPWVLESSSNRYIRVGADMAGLGRLLTGEHDRAELLALLDDRWTDEALERALRQLQSMQLLDDGRSRRVSSRLVTFAPPLTFQLSVLNPTRLLRAMSPLIALLSRRPALLAVAALSVAGLLALAVNGGRLVDAVSHPLTGTALLGFFAAVFVSTAIHELAHGAVLVHYGAAPKRMGVMLFYLLPAFFCDVSDGWRLPHNRQRVRVALAGVVAQFACAGVLALTALVLGTSTAQTWLLLAAASLYIAGVMNFVPFVKLDGYLALMAHLDVSNLRSKAIADARSVLGANLFGARRVRTLPHLRWAVPYGLACMAFPIYLVGFLAFALWSQTMADVGFVGAVLTLLLGCTLTLFLYVGLARLVEESRRAGAPLARIVVVLTAGLALLALAGSQLHLGQELRGNYIVQDGRALLLLPDNATTDLVRPGQVVELRTNGAILQPVTGNALIDAEVSGPAPDVTVLPFEFAEDLDLPVSHQVYELSVLRTEGDDSGSARVLVGERPLWKWLLTTYVEPVL